MKDGRWWTAAMIAAATGFVMLYWWPVFRHPDSTVLAEGGDGLKNYFTFAWHVRHDTTWSEFTGMYHPFGEHMDFTDGQPLLANTMRALAFVDHRIADHPVAIIHLTLLSGFVLATLFVFLSFLELRVPPWFAIPCALGVIALSPQMLRLSGHFSLAAFWCIPWAIWVCLRSRHIRRPWLFGAMGLIGGWIVLRIHLYLAVMVAGIIGIHGVLALIMRTSRRRGVLLITIAIVPLIAWAIMMHFTDHHVGRTEHPVGFHDYRTDAYSLISAYAHMRNPLNDLITTADKSVPLESSTYLGLAPLLVMFVILLVTIFRRSLAAGLRAAGLAKGDPGMRVVMFTALVFLFFSFGLPFEWGTSSWLWNTPFIRQFRSPGRFAWPFYYAMAIWTCSVAARILNIHSGGKHTALRGSLALLVPALLLFEGHFVIHRMLVDAGRKPNPFRSDLLTGDAGDYVFRALGHGPFTAILPLPFFQTGGEDLLLMGDDRTTSIAQIVAWHTGVPLLAGSLSRTGLDEVREQIGLIDPPWYDRPIRRRFSPDMRFLVLHTGTALTENEQRILDMSTPLDPFFPGLRELSTEQLFTDQRETLFAYAQSVLDTAEQYDGWTHFGPGHVVSHSSYEDSLSPHVFQGRGALAVDKNHWTVLASMPPGSLPVNVQHIATLWIHNRGPMRSSAYLGIVEEDTGTGQQWWHHAINPREARVIDGDWSMVELPFHAWDSAHSLRLVLTGGRHARDSAYVDELLIRQADTDVLRIETFPNDTVLFYNGHVIRSRH